jgi:hypothetical protein
VTVTGFFSINWNHKLLLIGTCLQPPNCHLPTAWTPSMNRSDKKRLRKTLFIDAKNQGEFIKQCFFRWYLCTSLIIAVVVIFTALNNPAQSALLLVYEVWK